MKRNKRKMLRENITKWILIIISLLIVIIPVFFIILQVLAPYFDSAYRKEQKVDELRQKLNELSINYLI